MKKFLYFLGILALIAGVVTSCNKDEDGDDNSTDNLSKQKKLVKVSGDDWWQDFKYDKDGRCISASYHDYDEDHLEDGYYDLFSYDGNKITNEEYNLDGTHFGTTTFTLNSNGYITSWELKIDNYQNLIKTEYSYNDKGQLIYEHFTEGSNESKETTYEWEDGKIIKEINIHDNSETVYKYTNDKYPTPIENKAGLNIDNIDDPILSKLGTPCKFLPVNSKYGDQYEWTLDNDGYPIKYSIIYPDGDKYTRELIWE